jgi:elongator complex protein 3
MPNLPGSSFGLDKKMFEEVFENPDFKPDYLKIYPCTVLKEAPLFKLWQKGKYKPYSEKKLIELLKEVKKKIPFWIRIQRLVRDIPTPLILDGCKVSNLRQFLQEIAKKEGWRCRCIRCREVKEAYNPKEKIYLFREDYKASDGKEIFLSFETKNREKLFSLLRLRIPSQVFTKEKHFLPPLQKAAIIRELHTYGPLVPISQRKLAPQHRGLGKKLIKEAEKITKREFGLEKIAVISGVGVRQYWRKLSYRLNDTYMIKRL